MRRLAAPLLLILLSAHCALAAAPTALQVLRRTAWAAEHVSYQGRIVTIDWLESQGTSAVANVWHSGDRTRFAYVAPRALAGQTVVITDGIRRQYNPRTNTLTQSPALPDEGDIDVALLLRNYRVTLEPQYQTVAERHCYVLHLSPKDPSKPHRVLWVDKASGLTLKTAQHRPRGVPTGVSYFTRIATGVSLPNSLFKLVTKRGVHVVSTLPLRRVSGSHSATRGITAPRRLPGGYVLRGESTSLSSPSRRHFRYSDGADMLSLYISPGSSALPTGRGTTRVTIHGRPGVLVNRHQFAVLTWTSRGRTYALVGDVTRPLLLAVANALR